MRRFHLEATALASLTLALVAMGCGGSAAAPDAAAQDDAGQDGGGPDGGPVEPDGGPVEPDGGPAPSVAITIAFEHVVGGAPLALGVDTLPYTNEAGNTFGVSRLSYFICDVSLTLADGTVVSAPGAHYVDHETPETLTYALPVAVPEGQLQQLSFVMGLTPALNQTGAFGSPPESLMEWPEMIGGGYHFMKLEGRYLNSASEPFAFMAHSGGLDGADYAIPVTLDAGGRALSGAQTLTVRMSIEEWFAHPDTWDLNDYFNEAHRGIMRDAAAQASLQRNGATVFSLGAP